MQVSGGHLLAAGLDGGNTLIFALKGQKCKSSPVIGTKKRTTPYGVVLFLFLRKIGLEPIQMQHAGDVLLAAGDSSTIG